MKRLMILGGTGCIIPVIKKAHELGLYVITCDYLPDNDAHAYADEYVNASVIDKEAVLKEARRLAIDGIISFACDAGAVSAAYVAEQMGLPFQGSYESVAILQDKGRFRRFLAENGFNVPYAKSYTDKNAPFDDIEEFKWPVIVKPVDSAGSKGVTRVDDISQLGEAIEIAYQASLTNRFIIEEFINFEGFHSSADPFTVDGKLSFVTYSDQFFDEEADNPYTPSLIVWPSTMKSEHQTILTEETQRLMDLLKMKTGIYNIETCVGNGGKPYLMEVSPRGGGCKIAEIQHLAYAVDLIENEIRGAVGMPLTEISQGECDGVWCVLVVHAESGKSGILQSITVDKEIEKKYLRVRDISAEAGDEVLPFTGGNMALGYLIFRFDTRDELDCVMRNYREWLHINLVNE